MQAIKFVLGDVTAGILASQALVLLLNGEIYTLAYTPCFCFDSECVGENGNGTSFTKQVSRFSSLQHCSRMPVKAAVTAVSCSCVIWGLYLMRLMSILQEKQSKPREAGR